MSVKKRKEYLILTVIVFIVGFFLYGMLTFYNRELLEIPFNGFVTFIIYGLGGGVLMGGLLSGILLFANIVREKKLYIKIILGVFFPITFVLICFGGIITFIPYGIYNCVKLLNE